MFWELSGIPFPERVNETPFENIAANSFHSRLESCSFAFWIDAEVMLPNAARVRVEMPSAVLRLLGSSSIFSSLLRFLPLALRHQS